MTETAKEARRAYKRKWNAQNRDKVREAQARYWERKAAELDRITDIDIPNPADGFEIENPAELFAAGN